jgi:hypothetical protein
VCHHVEIDVSADHAPWRRSEFAGGTFTVLRPTFSHDKLHLLSCDDCSFANLGTNFCHVKIRRNRRTLGHDKPAKRGCSGKRPIGSFFSFVSVQRD